MYAVFLLIIMGFQAARYSGWDYDYDYAVSITESVSLDHPCYYIWRVGADMEGNYLLVNNIIWAGEKIQVSL